MKKDNYLDQFNKNLSYNTTTNLILSEEQKGKLKIEFENFKKNEDLLFEKFISLKREYIEDVKHQAMILYFEKLKEDLNHQE